MNAKSAKVVITGGASGLGLAVVNEFLQHKAKITVLDIQAGENIREDSNLHFIETEITNESSVTRAIDCVTKEIGGITCLVNCAGIAYSERVIGRDRLHDKEEFSKVIGINLIGTFLMCRAVTNVMQYNSPDENNERGVIINTASISAFDGQIGQAAYAASKGGVVSLTLPLAREFASIGVRVMTIAPGLFNTPMFEKLPNTVRQSFSELTPFPKRLGKPEEFARLVSHIYENPMLNGEVIRLDGALRMPPK